MYEWERMCDALLEWHAVQAESEAMSESCVRVVSDLSQSLRAESGSGAYKKHETASLHGVNEQQESIRVLYGYGRNR